MKPPLNLRLVLALVISLLAFGLTAGVTLRVGGAGITGVKRGISNSLILLADQMGDELDRSLFERLRDIGDAARLFRTFKLTENPSAMRTSLDELLAAEDDYAWIGFADTSGKVFRATGGTLEGEDMSQRPWFKTAIGTFEHGGLGSITLEDFVGGQGPVRAALDIAQPVLDTNRQVVGVLVARINWAWAEQIRATVVDALQRDHRPDILVLSPSGTVILGPPNTQGKILRVPITETPSMQEGVFDGRRYLYTLSLSDAHRNLSGLGWTVIVRQDAQTAMAPVRELQHQMVAWGLGFSLLAAIAAWAVAGRIAAPLLKLAQAAQSIQRGSDMQMPELHSYAEAKVLSRSFASLVSDLKSREKALERLNETLESQVAARTSELALRNDALAAAYAEAEEATQAKSRFLTAASHDLRQPLHAMNLFARALSRRVHGEEAVKLVGQIEDSLRSLKGMFDALLNVSRLDAGLIQPSRSTISAKALIDGVSEGFRVDAESRGLRFLSRSIDVNLHTDPALLETMLRNLVSNALKFTRKGGVALIARRNEDQKVAFHVLDTGPGIGVDRQQRIFEEFERASEQVGGLNEGLGLGLSIVRRYAELLGIEVKLSSKVGHGTAFSLIMPPAAVADPATVSDHTSRLNGINVLPANLRVLVMDDDPMIVAAMTRDLADRGCELKAATSPDEAEAILRDGFQADALVVDFDLGCNETGLAFLGRMERAFLRKFPGLILTGGTDAVTLAAVTTSGVTWLTKPADPDIVASVLAGVIAKRRALPPGIETRPPAV
jgi:signal transduction histidine kinase/ActR/RegA family two-component response regulator